MELRKIHRGGERKASYVLTLPQQFLKALSIVEGDYVSLSLQDDKIVMVPVQERKQREEVQPTSSLAGATTQPARPGGNP